MTYRISELSDTPAVYISCNGCGIEQEIPYGEAINGEVPKGWTRSSSDKNHYCNVCGNQKQQQLHPGSDLRLFKPEWFGVDESLAPNQMRVGDDIVDINAQGGKQSHVDQAFHRLDPVAMLELLDVLGYGDKKYNEENCPVGDENWRKLHHLDHVNHAGIHLFKYLRELQFGPKEGDPEAGQHLGHCFCRIMFALGSKDATN